jgi:hypothetical protein
MALSARIAGFALAVLPAAASGQLQIFADSTRTAYTLNAGRFDYDMSAIGKTFLVAARMERPLSRYAVGEAGLLFARPANAAGDGSNVFIPEVQVQFQLPLRMVAPYLGFGGGVVWEPGRERPISQTSSGRVADPTFSVSAGARTWLTSALGFRAEVRRRWIGGEFGGSTTEWILGFSLRDPT